MPEIIQRNKAQVPIAMQACTNSRNCIKKAQKPLSSLGLGLGVKVLLMVMQSWTIMSILN